jgi:hypothetical protein
VTGERLSLHIDTPSGYVKADQVESIPPGRWVRVRVFFASNGAGDGTKESLSREELRRRFPGFRLVFAYAGGRFERHFPWQEIDRAIVSMYDYNNPMPSAQVRVRPQT